MWSKRSRHERGYGRAWELARAEALRRDLYLCVYCQALHPPRITSATVVHHRIEKAKGGTDDLANLVSLCRDCHERIHVEARGGTPKLAFDRHGRPIDPEHAWNRR